MPKVAEPTAELTVAHSDDSAVDRAKKDPAENTEKADPKAARADKPKGLLYYLGMGISGGLLALVILVGALVIVIPKIFGATPMTVLTSSMEPGLPPGTLIVVKPIETNDIQRGDVITYQIESNKPGVITHRVTAITNSSDGTRTFTLQGDNNDLPDELQVIPVQVVGKLWYSVPWIGYVASYVNGGAQTWVVPVAAIGLFIYAGFMIMSGIVTGARTRTRKRVEAELEAEQEAAREAELKVRLRAEIEAEQEAALAAAAAAAPVRRKRTAARKPAVKTAAKTVTKTATKATRTSAASSVEKSTPKPARKSAAPSAVKTTGKQAAKPAPATAVKPARKPAATSAAKPVGKPAEKAAPAPSAVKTTGKPAAKPAPATAAKPARKLATTSAAKTARKPKPTID